MRVYAPDYYLKFRCIARDCKHSCCVGWEIDIDGLTLKKYRKIKGDFGRRLAENISCDGDVASFKLDSKERCPFLNENGLCDIIINLGEDHLSRICTDHPRFRNFYTDRTEIGLGLCCEEACRIVLNKKDRTVLIPIDDDGFGEELSEDEVFILDVRERLFDIAQDRTLSVEDRTEKILHFLNTSFPQYTLLQWVDVLKSLEIMSSEWRTITDGVKSFDKALTAAVFKDYSTEAEQLLVYFLYRHITDASDLEDLAARGRFAVMSLWTVFCIFAENRTSGMEFLENICRLYSSEIEYSEENTERLLQILRP